MKLQELSAVVDKAVAATETQNNYVQILAAKVQAGEKTVRVWDEGSQVWTDVKLTDFWQIQYDKYLAMAGYSGDMSGLQANLQSLLDANLPTIALPEDRVKAATAAATA